MNDEDRGAAEWIALKRLVAAIENIPINGVTIEAFELSVALMEAKQVLQSHSALTGQRPLTLLKGPSDVEF